MLRGIDIHLFRLKKKTKFTEKFIWINSVFVSHYKTTKRKTTSIGEPCNANMRQLHNSDKHLISFARLKLIKAIKKKRSIWYFQITKPVVSNCLLCWPMFKNAHFFFLFLLVFWLKNVCKIWTTTYSFENTSKQTLTLFITRIDLKVRCLAGVHDCLGTHY